MCDICGKEGGMLWKNGLTVCSECSKKLPDFVQQNDDKTKLIKLCKTIINAKPPENCIFACPGLKVGKESCQLDARKPFCFPVSAIESANWEYFPRRKMSENRCCGELRALISFNIYGLVQGYMEAFISDNVTATCYYNKNGKLAYKMDDRELSAIKSYILEYLKTHDFEKNKKKISDMLMKQSQQMNEASARMALDLPPDSTLANAQIRKARNKMLGFAHPDRGGSDGMLFRISKAAEFLK